MTKKLGKITSVRIGLDRDWYLTFWLHFDFGGMTQGFGGYVLDECVAENKRRVGTAAGADAIRQLLVLFQVDDFQKIAGRTAYAVYENDDLNSSIVGVEVPQFDAPRDGPAVFLISEWLERWYPNCVPNKLPSMLEMT